MLSPPPGAKSSPKTSEHQTQMGRPRKFYFTSFFSIIVITIQPPPQFSVQKFADPQISYLALQGPSFSGKNGGPPLITQPPLP